MIQKCLSLPFYTSVNSRAYWLSLFDWLWFVFVFYILCILAKPKVKDWKICALTFLSHADLRIFSKILIYFASLVSAIALLLWIMFETRVSEVSGSLQSQGNLWGESSSSGPYGRGATLKINKHARRVPICLLRFLSFHEK